MTPEQIRDIRARAGLSQREFCRAYRIKLTALRCWEQGTRRPGVLGEALLTAIARDHEIMRELLA